LKKKDLKKEGVKKMEKLRFRKKIKTIMRE